MKEATDKQTGGGAEVHAAHAPLLRMAARDPVPAVHSLAIYAIALLFAMTVGAAIIRALGHHPLEVYGSMISGALGNQIKIQESVKTMIPLLLTSIAVAYAFRMKFWNIGAEGQILMGGISAMAVAIYGSDSLPRLPLLVFMGLASLIGGGIFGAIPAWFKARWGTGETLFTLMLNYVALQLVMFLAYQPSWQAAKTTFPKIRNFPATHISRLPKVFGVHIGWVIVLILVFLSWIYWTKTKQGYEMTVLGRSLSAARYAGMNVTLITVRTMFISAGLAGLAGFLIVSGADGTLTDTTTGGVGFTAITVAWMAHLHPFAMVLVSFFIAVLQRGSTNIQTSHGIPASAADLLTGIILFFMLGCEFFRNYKLIFRGKE